VGGDVSSPLNIFTSFFIYKVTIQSPINRFRASQNQSPTQRVNFLDGIRGLAALMVLLGHTIKDFLASVTPEKYDSIFLAFITDVRFAVAIFFVLSGYVLSVSQIENPKNLMYLFISRYLRLAIPVLATCTITYCLIISGFIFVVGLYQFDPTILGLLQFSLFDVFVRYDDLLSYSPVLWTISSEILGSYLLYILIVIFRRNIRYSLALAIVIACSLLFFWPFIACFIFGYLIFELNLRYSNVGSALLSKLSLLAFVTVVVVISFANTLDNWSKCLLASLFIVSVSYSPILKKVFTNSILLFLGKISFVLYLIHFSVICSLSAYIAIQFKAHDFVNLTSTNFNLLITVVVSIVCAALLNPLDTFSIRTSKKIGAQFNRLIAHLRLR
jgi:peptidoglycan/LPS O-acetylase OafA/YrhL